MSQAQRHDRLTEALALLPRQQASSGFTDEVLEELAARSQAGGGSPSRLIWGTAATLILACLVALGYGYQRQRATEEAYQAQVQELKSRYLELLDEVSTVRQEVATPDTRLYLGGDERLDLVLDLSQNPTYQDGRQDRQDVRPASWEQ